MQSTIDLIEQSVVAIVGPCGCGKTKKLKDLIAEHISRGDAVSIVSPYATTGEFKGLKAWGRGSNYDEVQEAIALFTAHFYHRRNEYSANPAFNPFDLRHIHLALDDVRLDLLDQDTVSHFCFCLRGLAKFNMSVSLTFHECILDKLSRRNTQSLLVAISSQLASLP